jgi:hypothetical protein
MGSNCLDLIFFLRHALPGVWPVVAWLEWGRNATIVQRIPKFLGNTTFVKSIVVMCHYIAFFGWSNCTFSASFFASLSVLIPQFQPPFRLTLSGG